MTKTWQKPSFINLTDHHINSGASMGMREAAIFGQALSCTYTFRPGDVNETTFMVQLGQCTCSASVTMMRSYVATGRTFTHTNAVAFCVS